MTNTACKCVRNCNPRSSGAVSQRVQLEATAWLVMPRRTMTVSDLQCYTTLVVFSSALKPIFLCVPSHRGLVLDPPHLHIAAVTLPSTTIRLGPSLVDLISTELTMLVVVL